MGADPVINPPVVDVDDRTTWPAPVIGHVDEWAARLDGTRSTCDLQVPPEHEVAFRRMFAGHLLRAYHCTRLLDRERQMILEHGLRPLTEGLVAERISAAHEAGIFTPDEREHYLRSHLFAGKRRQHDIDARANKVCLIFSRSIFDHDAGGVADLLDTWGGEALVSYLGWRSADRERLRAVGRASIVVAQLDIATDPERDFITPSMEKLFVASALKLDDVGAEIHYRSPVLSTNIEAIWQSGDAEYKRHRKLPRP